MGAQEATEELTRFQKYLESLADSAFATVTKVIFLVVLFIIGSFIIKLIRKGIHKSLEKSKIENKNIHFIDSVIHVLMYVVLICLLAGYFGVQTASIVAVLGSAGLTIGMAFQGSLSNFAGGILILFVKPFRYGDYIIVPSNNVEGEVVEIGLVYTKLKTIDNKSVIIPNSVLSNTTVTNVNHFKDRMLEIIVGVAYDSDIQKVKNILKNLIENEEHVIKEKDIKIFVSCLNSNSIDIGLRFFVKKENYFPTKWKILENIKNTFDENGIVIPFNQLDVHINKEI